MYEIAPLDPAEIGQDQSRVVGRDFRPSIPHTSHLFDGQVDIENLLFWAYLWLFGGSNGVPLGSNCVRLPTLDIAEVGRPG